MSEHPDNLTLMAYRDGELAGEKLAWVEGHVGGCAACQAEVASYTGLGGLFDEAREVKATAGLAERIKVKAREKVSVWGERETLKIARWLTFAAAGVMAVASAGLWLKSAEVTEMPMRVATGPIQFNSATTLMVADASLAATPGNEDKQFAQWVVADLSGRLAVNGEGR